MRALATAALALALAAGPARADTLAEAIAAAYATNPELAAERAFVRQVEEGVAIARSELRPSVGPSATLQQNLSDGFGDDGRLFTAQIGVTQPVWQGGRVLARRDAAVERAAGARLRLRALENSLVVQTVSTYAEVLRARAVVDLSRNQVSVLERQLQASEDRFEVGDVTLTDVAQSRARVEASRAQMLVAMAQADAAAEAYRRLVGRLPVDLEPLPPLPALPVTLGEARDLAVTANPALAAVRLDETAAAADVRAAVGERLPTVQVQGAGQYQDFSGGGGFIGVPRASGFTPVVTLSASVPLFAGGAISSRIRQAQARQSQTIETIAAVERQVVEQVVNGWTAIGVNQSLIASQRVAIEANALAAEGVREENLVGTRDILDVLNAEQELLSSQVQLVQAERDLYIAAYDLLGLLGRAEAVALGAVAVAHASEAHAQRLARRPFATLPNPREDRARDRPPGAPLP